MVNVKDFERSELAVWLKGQVAGDDLALVLGDAVSACLKISEKIRCEPFHELAKEDGAINVQGEMQKRLDIISNDIFVSAFAQNTHVAALVSEEIPDVVQNDVRDVHARFAVCFDPLDGSSNIETNGTIGSIFSVLRLHSEARPVTTPDVLAARDQQVAAGYVLYGPRTMLILTTGRSVAMFTLDATGQEFHLSRDGIMIPEVAAEFSINVAHRQFWEPAVAEYIGQLEQGKSGPRDKKFNMRWMGSMVADVHRLFIRGGIFIYPALSTADGANGKLRLLYEAVPMAMLVETAGGRVMSGAIPLDEVQAGSLHQRVPLTLGSAEEVKYLSNLYG